MAWKPDYVTTAGLKSYLRITDAADDTQVALAATTASRAIDQATGRQFGRLDAAEEWLYTPVWDRWLSRWVVSVDDLGDTTTVTVTVDGTAVTDYTWTPRQATAKGMVYTGLVLGSSVACTGDRDCVGIDTRWGWSAVPSAVEQATLLQGSRIMVRRSSPYGIAGSPDQGSEMRLLATVDPDVRVALGPYVRRWGAVGR